MPARLQIFCQGGDTALERSSRRNGDGRRRRDILARCPHFATTTSAS
jgi:hypothetical protein